MPTLVGMLFALEASTSPMANSKSLPEINIYHEIDPNIWLVADQIEWPSEKRGVLITFLPDVDPAIDSANLSEKARLTLRSKNGVVFGTQDGELRAYIIRVPTLVDRTQLVAAAAHEAFHASVQYSGMRPRLDLVSPPLPLSAAAEEEVDTFFEHFIPEVRQGKTCRALERLNDMGGEAQRYVFFHTYWEWPAEYYMKRSALPALSFEDYFSFRSRISLTGSPNLLYIAGVVALEQVEKTFTKADWQSAYLSGQTPLNILADATDCPRLQEDSIQVDIHLESIER